MSTHESSHRPHLESQGVFNDYRNSMNMDSEEYNQLKKAMHDEIEESPTFKFGERK